ncbi:MAG: hypothetical protein IKO61_10900 [Lachnospiraceae bacterium]|nr:hypothetical protein [Lachnospiraceae bacterium]
MSESTQAWIFLIGLIVFFIVLLIVTLVVLFGGGKDEEDEEKRVEEKKSEPKKADTKADTEKPEPRKNESKKSEDKKSEPKKADAKKESKPAKSVSKQEEEAEAVQAAHEEYSYEDEYYDEYDGYDDEDYDEYEDDETGKTDELKNPDIPPIEEIPVVSEENPVEKHKKSKKDKKKEAPKEKNEDIFTVAMDEDSIISRIEGDSEETTSEDKVEAEKDNHEEVHEENYWYNKEEVADRPSYRKPEAYYHYFRSAFDSLDELLTEMYDCAYVKTEEIRYIAYGIEPKTIFGNEELLVDEDAFIEKFKTKKPTMQDGVKIYEKWCGYVKSFLEIIEFHASKEMIEDINKKLCEYGKSDAKTLIKGK